MSYRKCLIDIDQGDKYILEEFRKLHSSFEEWAKLREDGLVTPSVNIIKYIVACYDHESPVVNEHRKRWTFKKKEAARVSGILFMREKLGSEIDDILYCRNQVINKLTIRYLSVQSDRDFMMYAIYNELLANLSVEIFDFKFESPGEVAKAKQNLEAVQEDIIALEKKLFSEDDVRALKNILQEESARFLIAELRPENLVSKAEKGEPVTDSPYGKSYTPPQLRFIDDQ